MKKNVDVSVSTDPISDYQNIIEYAKKMQGIADFLHCDIMSDNFVQKNTYDFNLVKNINRNSLIMLDVHLMVDEPSEDIIKYIQAGANIITLHYEAFESKENLVEALKFIQEHNVLAGISFKPSTPFKEIRSFVFGCDLVLVMAVEPGKSGQTLLEETFDKVKEVDEFKRNNNLRFKIEVDGGVNDKNSKRLIDCGADILVSGSFVYESKNRKEAVAALKEHE
ncbi:MAG: ribulose-phosphate 3-epimerase [Clostridia bacterium]|nr:ribulose-phosphate 3-epimerase [Clostridia bacterium]